MKKLLLVLSVVAMASFLLVGCLPSSNNAPVITSTPVTAGTVGTAYAYTVTATDADGDTLTFAVAGPTGMVIGSATGVISGWTPDAAGTFAVTVTVSDGTDSVTQSFNVIVPGMGPTDITIEVETETLPDVDGRIYVKGGSNEITVTFPATVDNPLVKVGTVDVPVFTVDNLVFKGTGYFGGACDAVQITVSGACEDICAAKSVVVDSGNPYVELEATVAACDCETGYALTISSDWSDATDCGSIPGCCGDDCSGLASWNVKIYDTYPWDDCCAEDPCVEPDAEEDGTACPISVTKECIDAVYTPDGWLDFFDHHFWVIATLTDNVGNEIKYYGEVITDPDADTLVSFVELYVDPTSLDCVCYAEDVDAADLVIGDCDGTPATECYAPALAECPEVTFDPESPIVGQETTITIDYSNAVEPECAVSAYVGPAIKTLPVGIPEGAQELVLTDNGDDTYTATYTFGQAGTDYIYVNTCCDECTPCKYGVTVVSAECPEIVVDSEVEFEGDMWVACGDHGITVDFAVPTDGVRVFVADYPWNYWYNPIIPEYCVEVALSSDDDMTFTGETYFWSDCYDYCDCECTQMWIYVLSGESCCPDICSEVINVDCEGPYANVTASCEVCDLADPCACAPCEVCDPCADPCNPDTGIKIVFETEEVCEAGCCGDECTALASWDMIIFQQDVWDAIMALDFECCEELVWDDCDVLAEASGEDCPVAWETPCYDPECLVEGEYQVILELEDLVGNVTYYAGILYIGGQECGLGLEVWCGCHPGTCEYDECCCEECGCY